MASEQTIHLTESELIAVADRSATSAVEKMRGQYRLRPVVLAALAGAIISTGIAIPVTLVVSHNTRSKADEQAQANAVENCRNISSVAAIEKAIAADQQRQERLFLAKSNDRFGLTPKQFAELEAEREQSETTRINQLSAIASTICAASVRTPTTTTAPKTKAPSKSAP